MYVIVFADIVRPPSKVRDVTSLDSPATGYQVVYRLLWCLFLFFLLLFVEKFILQRIGKRFVPLPKVDPPAFLTVRVYNGFHSFFAAVRFHHTAYNGKVWGGLISQE